MSGFFKNFDRILSSSVFSNPSSKYLVNFRLACYNPASLFFNKRERDTGIKVGHSYDLFSLSLSSYELVRQTQNYDQILRQVVKESSDSKDNKYAGFQNQLQTDIAKNNNFLNGAIPEILTQIRTGGFNLPAEGAARILTVLSETNNVPRETTISIVNQYLLPVINQKLQYFSTQNFIDTIVALSKLGLTTPAQKDLWERLFTAFNNQTLEWEYTNVDYHGWETDVYETREDKNKNEQKDEFFASNTERYWVDLQNGNALLAQLKRGIRCYWNWEKFYIIYPLFFREKRVNYSFDSRYVPDEKQRLFKALKELEAVFPDKVDSIRQRL